MKLYREFVQNLHPIKLSSWLPVCKQDGSQTHFWARHLELHISQRLNLFNDAPFCTKNAVEFEQFYTQIFRIVVPIQISVVLSPCPPALIPKMNAMEELPAKHKKQLWVIRSMLLFSAWCAALPELKGAIYAKGALILTANGSYGGIRQFQMLCCLAPNSCSPPGHFVGLCTCWSDVYCPLLRNPGWASPIS